MSLSKAYEILSKSALLLQKYESESEALDELQKAQVIQAMIHAKAQIEKELKNPEAGEDVLQDFNADFILFNQRLQEFSANLNFTLVQESLENLSTGVDNLLKQVKEKEGE